MRMLLSSIAGGTTIAVGNVMVDGGMEVEQRERQNKKERTRSRDRSCTIVKIHLSRSSDGRYIESKSNTGDSRVIVSRLTKRVEERKRETE